MKWEGHFFGLDKKRRVEFNEITDTSCLLQVEFDSFRENSISVATPHIRKMEGGGRETTKQPNHTSKNVPKIKFIKAGFRFIWWENRVMEKN